MHRRRLLIAALVLTLGCAPALGPRVASPTLDASMPVPTTVCAEAVGRPRFAFRSSFWLNLHSFLYREAKRRRAINDESPGARVRTAADTAGDRALTPDESDTWRRAVQFFEDRLARGHSRDSIVIRVDYRIGDAPDDGDVALGVEDSSLQRVLIEAAPIYRDVWWARHERTNDQWTRAIEGLLSRYLGCIAPRAANVFGREWTPPTAPIRVDASVYANWFGAFASSVAGPRITLSSNAAGNLELYGLETMVHEGVHAARILQSVNAALTAEAARRGERLPNELPHLVLFYTAGALVRDVVPTHIPYAERFGIWSQNATAARLHDIISEEWWPYLSGRRSFDDAIRGLVARTVAMP